MVVVELATAWLEGEHGVLDQRTVGCVGQHVEERCTVVLVGVEVHQRDDLRVEHRMFGLHFPAAEVLPQRMTHRSISVRWGEPSALEHDRGPQLTLGEADDSAVVVVTDVDDVLGDETHVGSLRSFVEDFPVVVAPANTHVGASPDG